MACFAGDLPEELDSLLTTDSVVRVSLGASEWASDDKVTPAKVAQSIVELADFLYLDSFCILAAAGAGTVALACAKLLTETRLKSVGIIAGMSNLCVQRLSGQKWLQPRRCDPRKV